MESKGKRQTTQSETKSTAARHLQMQSEDDCKGKGHGNGLQVGLLWQRGLGPELPLLVRNLSSARAHTREARRDPGHLTLSGMADSGVESPKVQGTLPECNVCPRMAEFPCTFVFG